MRRCDPCGTVTAVALTLGLILAWAWARPALAQAPGAPDQGGVASMARAFKDANKVYLGWRVYQDKCARCHGPAASGTNQAPNLVLRVTSLNEAQFTDKVLRRYKGIVPGLDASGEGSAREALIRAIIDEQRGELKMPSWQAEPAVTAHLGDLYEYLSARSAGAIGPERPPWSGRR